MKLTTDIIVLKIKKFFTNFKILISSIPGINLDYGNELRYLIVYFNSLFFKYIKYCTNHSTY